ncbi:MAG: TA system VapC family ribonuclease toxin [Acidimicrobiales bacterium]
MNLVDANVLLYAVNESDERHDEARGWLDGALGSGDTVAFSWAVLLAFLRLSTKVGLFPNPLSTDQAVDRVRRWTGHPAGVVVEPTARHLVLLSGLLAEVGSGGNLVSDAHLAALALELDAVVVTYDNDFDRFTGVRWRRPDELT